MTIVLAASSEGSGIAPGVHWTAEIGGLTFNIDTILSTAVAAIVVCGLGYYMARRATKGRPSGLQVAFEALTSWVQGQVREGMGLRAPRGVVGLCITLFAFILVANWIEILPTEHWLPAATADVNLVYPMAIMVLVWVNVAGIRKQGAAKHFGHLAKPYVALAPIEFIIAYGGRPLSLALRLWGNMFAGGLMIAIIGLLPVYVSWLANGGWKLFDMFIGLIQAMIFTLLTLVYFSEAVGSDDPAATH